MVEDYITYPKTFEGYQWYKPIVTIVLTLVIYLIFAAVEFAVLPAVGLIPDNPPAGGYESFNTLNFVVIAMLLSIALSLPALYIATKILKYRPFSSFSSSRGGWNWKLFFKCLTVPLAVYIVYYLILLLMFPLKGIKPVEILPFVLLIIVVPLQCLAEEYIFRGLLMQTFGSWFNIPILAIVIQAIFFALIHDYNSLGVVATLFSGLLWGYVAWKTNGLEATSALHSVTNICGLIVAALGVSSIRTSIGIETLVLDIVVTLVSAALLLFVAKRYDWFGEAN